MSVAPRIKNKNNHKDKDYADTSDPIYFVEMEDDKENQGLIISQKQRDKSTTIIASYYCKGFHHLQTEQVGEIINQTVSDLFASISSEISFKIEYGRFSKTLEPNNTFKTKLELQKQQTRAALIIDSRKLTAQLSQAGKVNDTQIIISIYHQVKSFNGCVKKNLYDNLLIFIQSYWQAFIGTNSETEQENWKLILDQVDQQNKDIEIKFAEAGLLLTPFSKEDCCQKYMAETAFVYSSSPPNYIVFNRQTRKLSEHISQSEFDVREQRLNDGVPICYHDGIKVKNKFVGVMVLDEKPSGWNTEQAFRRYLWDIIKDTSNVKIVSEIRVLDSNKQKPLLELSEKITSHEIDDGKVTDPRAEFEYEDTVSARYALQAGQKLLQVAVVILVYRESLEELHHACRQLCHKVHLPARLVREENYAWMLYEQAQFYSNKKLLVLPFNRTLTVLSNNIPAFLPLTKPQSPDPEGFELITDGGTPVYINYKNPRHTLLIGTTRSGKSVFLSGLLLFLATKHNWPITIVDFPGPDGISTFYSLAQNTEGAYINIRCEVLNIFELPHGDYVNELNKPNSVVINDFKDDLNTMLTCLLLGNEQLSADYKQSVEVIIGWTLERFFQDETIKQRYQLAFANAWGSEEHAQMPTMFDFIDFLKSEILVDANFDPQILDRVRTRLEVLAKGSARSLAGTSTVRGNEADLLVYALANMSKEEDALAYGLMVYSLIIRRATKYDRQLVCIDECPILLRFEPLAKLFAKLAANGAKFGIYLFFAAQDVETIIKSAGGDQILANISTTLVGKIKPVAIDNLQRILHCERSLLLANTNKNFGQNPKELSSQWLLSDINGEICNVKYYVPQFLLALVANNPSENKARNLILAHYYEPLEGLIQFSKLLKYCIARGLAPDDYLLQLIHQAEDQEIEVSKFLNQHLQDF